MYVAEQAASQLPFWADLPWRAAVIFAGGWLFGLLYADWMNTDSQLRKWWRKRRDFGEFSEVVFTKTYWDPGADRGGKRAFVDISLPFIFDGDTDLLDVRITAIKHRILFNTNNPEFTELQWTVFGQGKCLANERLNILIARLAIDPQYHGYYGDLAEANMGTYEDHGFKIDVVSATNGHVQSRLLYMRVPHRQQDARIEADRYYGDRFFLEDEGNPSFGDLKKRLIRPSAKRTVWHPIARRH